MLRESLLRQHRERSTRAAQRAASELQKQQRAARHAAAAAASSSSSSRAPPLPPPPALSGGMGLPWGALLDIDLVRLAAAADHCGAHCSAIL